MQRGRKGAAHGRGERIIVKDVPGTVAAGCCALSAFGTLRAWSTGTIRTMMAQQFPDNSAVLARRVQEENEGSTGDSHNVPAT